MTRDNGIMWTCAWTCGCKNMFYMRTHDIYTFKHSLEHAPLDDGGGVGSGGGGDGSGAVI